MPEPLQVQAGQVHFEQESRSLPSHHPPLLPHGGMIQAGRVPLDLPICPQRVAAGALEMAIERPADWFVGGQKMYSAAKMRRDPL